MPHGDFFQLCSRLFFPISAGALSLPDPLPSALIVKALFDEFYARDHPVDARRLDDQVTRILDGETNDNAQQSA